MAIVINGSGTVTGISVGGLPDGIVDDGTLATDSVTAAKLKDDAIATGDLPAGSVLQVVSADIGAYTSSTAQEWVETNATIDITPQFSNSKIICMFNFGISMWGGARLYGGVRLVRDDSVIGGGSTEVINFRDLYDDYEMLMPVAINFVDSPAVTSSTTYKIQIYAYSGLTIQLVGQGNTRPGHMILMEIAG
jgi:hypothetical protein